MESIESKIIQYCQQRNIPITDGNVLTEYRNEIMDFTKILVVKMKKQEKENNMGVKQIVKELVKSITEKKK